jgi:hypothetical protein
MRECVRRYNASVGGENTTTSGYHETITVAWIKVIDGLLREVGPVERAEFARLAVQRFEGDKGIWGRYYEFDLVRSVDARMGWVAPTLKELD